MTFLIGSAEDLTAAETAVWIANLRYIASVFQGNTLRDVIDNKDVDAGLLSDAELNERERFPMFGYTAGKLNTTGGYTHRWAEPTAVTKSGSAFAGEFFMPMPSYADPDTQARVMSAWSAVASNFPDLHEEEVARADLVKEEELTEGDV